MSTIEHSGVLSRVMHRPGRHTARRGGQIVAPQHDAVMRRDFGELDADRVTSGLLALRRELPAVQIHFALTSLLQPATIRAVDAFGASFAVASRGEIDLLERQGVAIGRCVHSHPVKTIADITGAYLRGIRTFVVDNAAEVAKFSELPDVAVLVRLSFPDPDTRSDLPDFGVAPDDAGALVEQCLRTGLRVSGFTFHFDGPTVSAQQCARAIRRTLRLMRKLEHVYDVRFDTIDIGGLPPVAELARDIRTALAPVPPRYRILIESGRQSDLTS